MVKSLSINAVEFLLAILVGILLAWLALQWFEPVEILSPEGAARLEPSPGHTEQSSEIDTPTVIMSPGGGEEVGR
jgi:hypothetical protein